MFLVELAIDTTFDIAVRKLEPVATEMATDLSELDDAEARRRTEASRSTVDAIERCKDDEPAAFAVETDLAARLADATDSSLTNSFISSFSGALPKAEMMLLKRSLDGVDDEGKPLSARVIIASATTLISLEVAASVAMASGKVDFRPLATSRRPATELAVEKVILVEDPAIALVAELTTAAIAPAFCIALDVRAEVRVTPDQATPTPPMPSIT
jgi:hypothetical protein